MQLDSTIVATLIAIIAGAIGSLIGSLIAGSKSDRELEKQDIRIESAITRLKERSDDTRSDMKELEREFMGKVSLLEQRLDESDRRFRSLVNVLASKGIHYRFRSNERETLS